MKTCKIPGDQKEEAERNKNLKTQLRLPVEIYPFTYYASILPALDNSLTEKKDFEWLPDKLHQLPFSVWQDSQKGD